MEAPRETISQSLKAIDRGNLWRMELVGTPTYLAGALLSLRFGESSIIGSLLIFLCFLVIYTYGYEFVFPKFNSRRSSGKLTILLVAQLAFWGGVLYLLSIA